LNANLQWYRFPSHNAKFPGSTSTRSIEDFHTMVTSSLPDDDTGHSSAQFTLENPATKTNIMWLKSDNAELALAPQVPIAQKHQSKVKIRPAIPA